VQHSQMNVLLHSQNVYHKLYNQFGLIFQGNIIHIKKLWDAKRRRNTIIIIKAKFNEFKKVTFWLEWNRINKWYSIIRDIYDIEIANKFVVFAFRFILKYINYWRRHYFTCLRNLIPQKSKLFLFRFICVFFAIIFRQ
jgi:hypothetical protein